jgi:hypothetical protein
MTPLAARIAELRALGIASMDGVILELARGGTPGPVIAGFFGIELRRIAAKCRRAGVELQAEAPAAPATPPLPEAPPPPAGATRDAEIRDLAGRGLSAGEIATRLGLTRNAVIGLCHRRGIALRRGRGGVPANARITVSAAGPDEAPAAAPQPAAPRTAPRGGGEGCRWPLRADDEQPTHVYCGAPRDQPGRPYCAAHAARARGRIWRADQVLP